MRLSHLIEGLDAQHLAGPDPEAVEVSEVTSDSRRAGPGVVFVAIPGTARDGHAFAPAAAEAGAAALVVERPVEAPEGVCVLAVDDARKAVAALAAAVHGRPADRVPLVGLTGTNGKTSVTFLLEAAARAAGRTPGVLGTLGWRVAGQSETTGHTTPAPESLHRALARMEAAGADLAVLEVSSHGLDQERVHGCRFAAAGFTNLTRDHLDYHPDLEAYFGVKRRLFTEHLADGGTAVVHLDDPWGQRLARELRAEGRRVLGTTLWPAEAPDPEAGSGIEAGARAGAGGGIPRVAVTRARSGLDGIEARFVLPDGDDWVVRSPLVGAHNLANLAVTVGLAFALGLPGEAVVRGLAESRGAPGRLERVEDPRGGRHLFVDYAHTDDALARVIAALRAAAPEDARLIVVFGAGGDRDRGKRPLMGRAASAADVVVVTSDNPRSEDPAAIIEAIREGLDPAVPQVIEPDRGAAIARACGLARPGDVVLVAGKGHETGQIVGETVRPFDDREVSQDALAAVAPATREDRADVA